MSEIEKIEGPRILGLFEELQQEGAPLKLFLSDSEYEHLTCIVDIQTQKKNIYFLIQYAQDFKNIILNSKDDRSIDFEFTGKDGVKYLFHTQGCRVLKGKIWLKLPPVIEREQRRRQFRISTPSGSKLFFRLNSKRYELEVVDISVGGSLAILGGPPNRAIQDQNLLRVKHLQDVELVFPPESENMRVIIHYCEIKRLGRNPVTNQYEYGLEFHEMDKANTKKLNHLVYRFQREFLRKRLRVNA
jgi:c-di-GMP-binding flagellar brake protein YcgR